MEKAWWMDKVVYQIYPRSFKDSNGDGLGDLNGIAEKLDYIKELGVDVIWLSPIYESPNDDNGYDISNYQNIMAEFGTMEDFDKLLEEAHKRDLKIMLDLVVNHTSDEHKWFKESRKSKDNKYRDYYIWEKGDGENPPNNWSSNFSGSAWDYDEATDMYYLHLFSKKQPDLNWKNTEVRNEVYTMMKWWCDKGIDGFRMDVINMISKVEGLPDGERKEGELYGNKDPYVVNGPHVHEYLQEMNREVLSKYKLMTVGETPLAAVDDAKLYTGFNRNELNMVFQFEHMDVDKDGTERWTDKKFNLVELKKILSKWQTELYGCGWNSLYWNNHDQPRTVSRFGNDKEYRVESAKMLGTCLHMLQGTPYIYQGEELGMTNVKFNKIEEYDDIESVNAYKEYTEKLGVNPEEMLSYIQIKSRDNARTPMQWNDRENAGFTTGKPWLKVNHNYKEINAASQVNDPNSIFNYYKKLIKLRKKYEIIILGNYELLLPDDKKIFAYKRYYNGQTMLIVCNFSEDILNFPFKEILDKNCIISNYECNNDTKLRPYEARVYLY
jgi:oligo-1,6-glucosidase